MKVVLQRVTEASVTVNNKTCGLINQGLLILLGIDATDCKKDIDWLIRKIINLRIFNDEENRMNCSVTDIKGDLLIISQFTLHANVKKGNRPSFTNVAPTTLAKNIYQTFTKILKERYPYKVQYGVFGADMKVHLLNDGPVTILIDTKDYI